MGVMNNNGKRRVVKYRIKKLLRSYYNCTIHSSDIDLIVNVMRATADSILGDLNILVKELYR